MFQDFVNALARVFISKPCSSCIAKDYFIATLKEQLRNEQSRVDNLLEQSIDVERHLLRMSGPVIDNTGETNFTSRPRNNSTIGSRIREAERASKEQAKEQGVDHKKEYNERVESLLGKKEESDETKSTH